MALILEGAVPEQLDTREKLIDFIMFYVLKNCKPYNFAYDVEISRLNATIFVCLLVYYSQMKRLRFTELLSCLLFCMGVKLGCSH
jgi:hypothetical protein